METDGCAVRGVDPVSRWWLQTLGPCLGTAVTLLLLLSSFVCWAMAPTQLYRSRSTQSGSMPSKISRGS